MTKKISIDSSSISIIEHDDKDLLSNIREIIKSNFNKDTTIYNELQIEEFRKLVSSTQNQINDFNVVKKLSLSLKGQISEYLSDDFLVQSNCYLRAARPNISSNSENIGWHRESFYSDLGHLCYNIWTPVLGVNENNTIQYIPESQMINEKDIITENQDDSHTKKFSSGHKIGFLYSPKVIRSGVDLNKNKRLIVPKDCSAVFSGNLIHGAGNNTSSEIRFSLDFRIIPKQDYNKNKSLEKSNHFSSGKSYFIDFSE